MAILSYTVPLLDKICVLVVCLSLLVLQPTAIETSHWFVALLLLFVIIWIYGTRSRMSSEIASKKRPEKHCDWAFDITTQFQASSDEDSESDSDQKLATTYTGTSGLLSDDGLDLSKRGESVAYNPNPFSIAKINAAYRRQTSTVQPIQPVGPSDEKLATSNTGAGGLLIDDLDLLKPEGNVAYNPNPYSIAKINATYRPQASAVQPIQRMWLSNQQLATTNTGAGGLLMDDLDLSKREENVAYNPNPSSISKINAPVYRPQTSTVNGPVVQASQSARLANKPTRTQQLTKRSRTNSNQTTIMEGFKTQAMKKPRINALQLRVQVPPLLPTSNLISPSSNLAVNKPPANFFPSASLLSSPSPSPSNYLAKMRMPVAKRDAYQYSTEDLDEEWSTLPSKKRKRKPKFFPISSVIFRICVDIFLAQ